ncbi:uridine phosphorylase [Brachyspira pilosicoli WesB]|uniref:Uridine phosphorylase n=1 Tax=Brachyspira pilosicoli WesB TaxID=1161918 RepID=K0JJ42_BRAPL|nr:nucleoside phosphorylase [Brachyspira pilosicoli]CCG56116.1 uridine phosphorylase [Brachyspira pilosicoli WesB]
MEYREPKAFYDEEASNKGLLQYHIKLKKGDVARYVLLPGDPKRVEYIASFLDDVEFKADYREYVTVTGKYKNVPVSVTSTGIGGPSASIAMEELIKVGADTFIRVGTGGGLSLKVKPCDLAIAQAAIKDEGTSLEYIPFEYPAIANTDIVFALRDAAKSKNYNYHIGVVHSKDCFYGELEPENSFFRERFENNLKYYTLCGAIVSEMECAALFSCAAIRNVRAGGIMHVVENTMIERMGTHLNYSSNIDNMILTALEAIVLLEKRG